LTLEIYRAAKADSARTHAVAGLFKECSRALANAFEHPFAPTGMRRVALRNHQPAAFAIEDGEAEMCAPDVNGERGMW